MTPYETCYCYFNSHFAQQYRHLAHYPIQLPIDTKALQVGLFYSTASHFFSNKLGKYKKNVHKYCNLHSIFLEQMLACDVIYFIFI